MSVVQEGTMVAMVGVWEVADVQEGAVEAGEVARVMEGTVETEGVLAIEVDLTSTIRQWVYCKASYKIHE